MNNICQTDLGKQITLKKAYVGKAPGPDIIPNKILKYLPESAHDLNFQLFHLMDKHSYTPQKWCTSATNLIYKPNKPTHITHPSIYRLR